MAISTGVVGDTLMAAGVAALDVTAEGGGAAALDGAHDAALSAREPLDVRLPIDRPEAAEDIRHFEWCSGHRQSLEIGRWRGRRWRGFRPGQQVEGTGGGAHGAGGDLQVAQMCSYTFSRGFFGGRSRPEAVKRAPVFPGRDRSAKNRMC